MREIALDTETTGLDPATGDRIFEIGCVEMINRVPSGEVLHLVLDPERPLSQASIDITGYKDADLVGKPRFADILQQFQNFIGDDPLVIHNAAFDVKFINAEFARLGAQPLNPNRIVDTLRMARKRFPGAQNSLDALCRRFSVDNSAREKHGALLDSALLAEVYLELTGGRQPVLGLGGAGAGGAHAAEGAARDGLIQADRPRRRPLLTAEEATAHAAFVGTLGEEASWRSLGVALEDPEATPTMKAGAGA